MRVTDMTQIELTEEELGAVAGGQNHGQNTSAGVHYAQYYVMTQGGGPAGGQMGTQVSQFAHTGAVPP
jgi:hypothetical protein